MEKENFNEETPLEEVTEQELLEETSSDAQPEIPSEEVVEAEADVVSEDVAQDVDQPEVSEPKKKKDNGGMIAVISLLAVALAAALTLVVLMGAGIVSLPFGGQTELQNAATNPPADGNIAVTDPTVGATDPAATTEPIDLKSYTVDDETAISKANDVVATVGNAQLTNGELHIYYWMGIYDFISANSYYLSFMGVDFSKPLDQQVYDPEAGTSWQEAMLDYALNNWNQFAALCIAAEEAGYELDENGKAYMDGIEANIAEMVEACEYESLEALLANEMGAGATGQGYRNYMKDSFLAIEYFNNNYESMIPTLEQIQQYFTENEQTLAEAGITKEAGDVVDVRHILICPQGGTTGEDNTVTYSEQEWETCRQKAQELLDQWKSGEATEDSFAALAGEHTEDPGSKETGGLYEAVTEGYMVTEFNDWIFDESRQYGDTDLVKTSYGYHIMYFVEREEGWISQTKDYYMNQKANDILKNAIEKYPMEVNYELIALSEPKATQQ